jgi:hypothetical protein
METSLIYSSFFIRVYHNSGDTASLFLKDFCVDLKQGFELTTNYKDAFKFHTYEFAQKVNSALAESGRYHFTEIASI